jgi:TIR domain
MPVQMFLSYRREANHQAKLLYAALTQRFGRRQVFKDVESIAAGSDYVAALQDALATCDVLVAMIDRHWAVDAAGRNRLADPHDWVRREIEIALERRLPLIPVLLEDAAWPDSSILPPSMLELDSRQSLILHRSAWADDIDALSTTIETVAVMKAGGRPDVIVEGGNPLSRSHKRHAFLIAPGTRIRIGTWAGTIKPEETGLPFEIVAAAGQTGTVLRLDDRIAIVRWDQQRWSKVRFAFLKGSPVELDSFETTINADWLEPLQADR